MMPVGMRPLRLLKPKQVMVGEENRKLLIKPCPRLFFDFSASGKAWRIPPGTGAEWLVIIMPVAYNTVKAWTGTEVS